MRKIKLLALAWVGILIHQAAFAQVGELSGKVTDAKTGEPLIGASVQLQDTEMGAITDVNGSYLIKEIPAKTYSVKASFLGYDQQIKYNVVIRSEGNIDVNFLMDESSQELEGVTVVANPFVKEAETPLSIQKLSQEEVASYPGGNNDIAKVVQSLPA